MLKNSYIKEFATEVGFDLVGVTYPREFEQNRTHFEGWLASGRADTLGYMHKYMDVRFDPSKLLDGTKTVVVCAINYKNSFSLAQKDNSLPKIASYALNTDYHKVVRNSLKKLLKKLQATDPTLSGRCCTDTAPLLEKQLAVEAGLGWIGRQSLLVTPEFGTFVVLGVLLLSSEVDHFDSPFEGSGCGECNACVAHCPTAALSGDKMVDSRHCISALTIECDNPHGEDLHGWIFGCDECQRHCPHNRESPLATNPALKPIFAPITTQEWLKMSPEEFTQRLGTTPMKRGGLERLQLLLGRYSCED